MLANLLTLLEKDCAQLVGSHLALVSVQLRRYCFESHLLTALQLACLTKELLLGDCLLAFHEPIVVSVSAYHGFTDARVIRLWRAKQEWSLRRIFASLDNGVDRFWLRTHLGQQLVAICSLRYIEAFLKRYSRELLMLVISDSSSAWRVELALRTWRMDRSTVDAAAKIE